LGHFFAGRYGRKITKLSELALFYVAENSTVDVSAVTERNDG
jgi:hypothetical protein